MIRRADIEECDLMLPVAGSLRGLRSTIVQNLSLLRMPSFSQAASLLCVPSFLLRILLHGATVGAFVYLVSTSVAAAIGFALPTTALMRWSPAVSWLATYDYYAIYLLLLIVMLCVVSSWLATWSAATVCISRRNPFNSPAQSMGFASRLLLLRVLVECTLVWAATRGRFWSRKYRWPNSFF